MTNKSIITSALAALVATGALAGATQALAADKPDKCYGIAKAGSNDCQTANSSCAGTSTVDGQPDAWVYVPSGTCEKLVGGSLEPKG
jgi:uncharacterized membrane protein